MNDKYTRGLHSKISKQGEELARLNVRVAAQAEMLKAAYAERDRYAQRAKELEGRLREIRKVAR